MTRLLLLFLLLFVLAGCSARGPGGSFVGELPEEVAQRAIASDSADFLAQEFPPGHTRLHLLTPKERQEFSPLLEASLRKKGFVVSQESDGGAQSVAYTLDKLDDQFWYVQLRIDGGKAVSRVYDIGGRPVASRASIGLEKGILKEFTEKASRHASEAADSLSDGAREIF